jgi:putative zinc finger protein
MNCQEVQLQISGYLEKSLDAIRMKSIETHLSSCPFCRAEVHALSDCIRLVAELPAVEPPPGFTERVMAHARAIEPEPRSWQRFFAAFKLTVPVQAAAVVLVSVLAVLLYQRQPEVKNFAFTGKSSSTMARQAEPGPVDNARSHPKSDLRGLNMPTERSEPAPSRPRVERESNNRPVEKLVEPAAKPRQSSPTAQAGLKDAAAKPQSPAVREAEKTTENEPEGRIAAQHRPAIQAQEVSTLSQSPRTGADSFDVGAAIGALSRSPFRASPFSADRALSPLSEPSPDFEFVVKRRPSARAAANDALRKRSEASAVTASASERSAAAPAPLASQIVEIRWFTVLPEHYEQFRKELAAEAIIDAEKSSAAKEPDFGLKPARELLIKVTILPADR